MSEVDERLAPWPAAFSASFISGARALFDERDHVMIVGPLGSGRSSLAEELAGSCAPTAWGPDAQGAGLEAPRYSVITQLLPTVRAAPGAPPSEIVLQARDALDHSFGRPTVCLREADLCDEGSIDVLASLVEDGRIRLVSTVSPSAAQTHRFARSALRIDLPPLDHDTATALLRIRFGAEPHPMAVAMLLKRSGGAYALLKAFADASHQAGQLRVLAGSLVTDEHVPSSAVDDLLTATTTLLPSRLEDGRFSRDLLDVTAVAMELDHDDAVAAFGAQNVAVAIGSGALEVCDGVLRFRSTFEGQRMVSEIGAQRLNVLFDTYWDQFDRSRDLPGTAARAARWLLAIDRPPSADLALRAARHSNQTCRYSLVHPFIAAVPPDDRTPALVLEHYRALSESGAQEEATALLRSLDPAAVHDDDVFAYVRGVSRYLPRQEAADLVGALLDHSASDDEPRRSAVEVARLFGEVYQTGDPEVRRRLQTLTMSAGLSGTNRALARIAVSTSLRHASRADQAVETAAIAIRELHEHGAGNTSYADLAREAQILAHLAAADLDGARDALVEYSTPGAAHGNLGRLGSALWGLLAFYAGDVGASMAQAQLCLARTPVSDPHQIRSWIEAMAAQVLTQIGDIDHVYELLESSHQRALGSSRQLRLELAISQACVHDAIGEPEEALDLLQAVVEEAHEHHLLLNEVDAAVLSVQIGGPIHLGDLLRAVESVDDTHGTSTIWKTFAHAIRDNDMHRLVDLAEELAQSSRVLFAAEVAQFTLDIARRAADMTPEQRTRLSQIADPMQHRTVTRAP